LNSSAAIIHKNKQSAPGYSEGCATGYNEKRSLSLCKNYGNARRGSVQIFKWKYKK